MSEEKLGLFAGDDKPNEKTGWALFQEGKDFNTAINLEETVKANENFYIGKQWEGVQANGLPTPQINILKRVAGFIVATITTDNIKVNASPLSATPNTDELIEPAQIVNEEFDSISERLNIPFLIREFARNAAVDGDGCMYTYWDAEAETGQDAKGAIETEIIENTRVYFGNPNDRRVQSQPWIMIALSEPVRNAKLRAKGNGISTWTQIKADDETNGAVDQAKRTDNKVTVLKLMWRDDESRSIWAYEFTQNSAIKEPWDMKLNLYPICWLNWDYVQDCYHGQAMLTGLIPNQNFINRAYAMAMLSITRQGFPKYVYNRQMVSSWDNRVGAAIGIQGGDINNVAKAIDPPMISPQVSQFIQLTVEQTEQSLGATSVALGDTRPDNTSAIIALQRAASTPSELTKQNLYRSVEDLFRIYLEFMAEYYGERYVDMTPPEEVIQAAQFAGMKPPTQISAKFDFSTLKQHPYKLKIDVGASSYYSEIASIQTLDNLLQNGHITPLQYLERIPDGYIPSRRALINEMKAASANAATPLMGEASAAPHMVGDLAVDQADQPPIPTGGGYSDLQRKINQTGEIPE